MFCGMDLRVSTPRRVLAPRRSPELDAMCVVDEPVADGVGQGRVPEVLVPGLRGQLAGDEGGAVAVAVLQDVQERLAILIAQGREPEPLNPSFLNTFFAAQYIEN